MKHICDFSALRGMTSRFIEIHKVGIGKWVIVVLVGEIVFACTILVEGSKALARLVKIDRSVPNDTYDEQL